MTPQISQDLKFLDQQYDAFVTTAVQRSEKGKRLNFKFNIRADDLKTGTNRARLHDEIISYVLAYFTDLKAGVVWNPKYKVFQISLNLIDAVLNVSQAQLLSASWK